MACSRRKAFLFRPSKSSFSKGGGGGELFFVGFAGDFFWNTFLQFLSIQLLQGHKRQHQKTVGHAKYVEEDMRLKCCFLLLPDRSRTSCVNHVRHKQDCRFVLCQLLNLIYKDVLQPLLRNVVFHLPTSCNIVVGVFLATEHP